MRAPRAAKRLLPAAPAGFRGGWPRYRRRSVDPCRAALPAHRSTGQTAIQTPRQPSGDRERGGAGRGGSPPFSPVVIAPGSAALAITTTQPRGDRERGGAGRGGSPPFSPVVVLGMAPRSRAQRPGQRLFSVIVAAKGSGSCSR